MLVRAQYEVIKILLLAALNSEEAIKGFVALPAPAKVQVVQDILAQNKKNPHLAACTEAHAKCYVLLFCLAMETVPPGSEAHYALREELGVPVISAWPKGNPPTSIFDLVNGNRNPSYLEEYAAAAAACELLSFTEVANTMDVISAVKTAVGIGGMEDAHDTRAIQPTDKLLHILCEVVTHAFAAVRPEWCGADGLLLKELPDGVDSRPLYVLKAETELKRKAEKAALKLASDEKRKAQLQKCRDDRKAEVFAATRQDKHKEAVDRTVAILNASTFAGLRVLFDVSKRTNENWLPSGLINAVGNDITLPQCDTTEQAKAALQEAVGFIQQCILEEVAKVHPLWFARRSNGDLKLRKAEGQPAAIPGPSRTQRSLGAALSKLVTKYGRDAVKEAYENLL